MVDAKGVAAHVIARPLLNHHVHLTRGELERAHVEIAADEFECETIAGNQQAGLLGPGHRHPHSLDRFEIGASRRLARTSENSHDKTPEITVGRRVFQNREIADGDYKSKESKSQCNSVLKEKG